VTAKTDAVAWDDAGATALLPLARGATLFEERPFVLAAARADGFGAAAKWRATVRAATKRRGAFEMHGAVFGADRSDAAGRDVDIPRAIRKRTKTDDQEDELAGWCGPTVFAGRIAATPRGATWMFRG